jgi:hypothetical protein
MDDTDENNDYDDVEEDVEAFHHAANDDLTIKSDATKRDDTVHCYMSAASKKTTNSPGSTPRQSFSTTTRRSMNHFMNIRSKSQTPLRKDDASSKTSSMLALEQANNNGGLLKYHRANSRTSERKGSTTAALKSRSICVSNAINLKKQKLKILILIATVSITFALTWLPAHIINIWRVAFESSFPYNDFMYIVKFIAHTLNYTNSVLNPFIYVFIGTRFRNHIYSEFSTFFCIRKFKANTSASGGPGVAGNNKRDLFLKNKFEARSRFSVDGGATYGGGGGGQKSTSQLYDKNVVISNL